MILIILYSTILTEVIILIILLFPYKKNLSSNLTSIIFGEVKKMAVKHTPTNIVHQGMKGGKTGCGTDTKDIPSHWQNTNERINCQKNGCN